MVDQGHRQQDYDSKTREELIAELRGFHETMIRCGSCDLAALDPAVAGQSAGEELLHEVILNSALDAIIMIDEQGRILRFNRSAEQIFGYRQQDVIGKEIAEVIIPPSLRERHAEGFSHYLQTGKARIINKRVELEAMRRGGDLFPIELTVTSFRARRKRFFTAFIRDITQRQLMEERLHRKTALVALLHRLTSVANEARNPEQAMEKFLEEVCLFTRWPVGHAYLTDPQSNGQLISSKVWYFEDDTPYQRFREITEGLVFRRNEGLPGRVLGTGKPLWVPDTDSDHGFIRSGVIPDTPIRSGFALPVISGTEVVGVLEFFTPQISEPDSTFLDSLAHIGTELGRVFERRKSEQMLQQQASQDPLTGLPNLRLGRDRLESAVASARRTGTRTALLFIDLDNFKQINDTRGHDVGDQVLTEVAGRLSAGLRESDTVARLGGDEFLAILSSVNSRAEAQMVADKLARRVSEPFTCNGRRIAIGASIGVAVCPDDGETSEQLLCCADNAMYAEKRRSKRL